MLVWVWLSESHLAFSLLHPLWYSRCISFLTLTPNTVATAKIVLILEMKEFCKYALSDFFKSSNFQNFYIKYLFSVHTKYDFILLICLLVHFNVFCPVSFTDTEINYFLISNLKKLSGNKLLKFLKLSLKLLKMHCLNTCVNKILIVFTLSASKLGNFCAHFIHFISITARLQLKIIVSEC